MKAIHRPLRTLVTPTTHLSGLLLLLLLGSGCELAPELLSRSPGSKDPVTMGGHTGIVDEDPIIISPDGGAPNEEPPAKVSVCDNGVLEPGELCDDGIKTGLGCSKDCKTQDADFDCSEVGKACKDTVVCGNGVLEGDEACDDKNEQSNDGCTDDCALVEEGFVCLRPGVPCVERPVCGNGARERGEACDDGDDENPDDGCHACVQDDNFFCVPGKACVELVCGDGNRTPDEECDDGPGTPGAPGTPEDGDGCSADCQVEPGYRCSNNGCYEACGDGVIVGSEQSSSGCDDSNRDGGDGCSSACSVEPFHSCNGIPSSCSSTVSCGNASLEPGEICDPPGVDGCLPGCASFSPDVEGGSVCGNGRIEGAEECDAPSPGFGCSLGCLVEEGWSCPRPNQCVLLPRCGDAVAHFQLGEECDDGNETNQDGCTSCKVDGGYTCTGLGPSLCFQEICGDGDRTESEECDDGNGLNTDGCSGCTVTTGWACPAAGQPCVAKCGDGLKVGNEVCDDGNGTNGDGCNKACTVEPGYTCDAQGCTAGVCGNAMTESGEGCDDNNKVAGDGCGPTCQQEPQITRDTGVPYPNPATTTACGDGIITGAEQCDDGNTRASDGCSSTCQEEEGYNCTKLSTLPTSVEMKLTYRDYKRRDDAAGHPDFEYGSGSGMAGLVGPACTTANNTKCEAAAGAVCQANTCGFLDKDGKPVLHKPGTDDASRSYITSANAFSIWYRDTNTVGVVDGRGSPQATDVRVIQDKLTLAQTGGTSSNVYNYTSGSYFPLTDRGFGNTPGQSKNFHFTTELRYFFQYQGGESLTFQGDDDVWVFINGYLAVDVGGLHPALKGRVILGDDGGYNATGTDSNCSRHIASTLPACTLEAAETASQDADDTRFHLEKDGIYEIVLFHAERHTDASNFNLTLAGFLPSRSYCTPECGDNKIVGNEVCDDGANNKATPATGECNSTCTARAYCGDGTPQAGEACDNGLNRDRYLDTSKSNQCAPGCEEPPRCGDSGLQAAYEECDNGPGNSNQAYGANSCTNTCTLGGYCGDGSTNGSESCDLGSNNGKTYGLASCSYDCQPGPRCGDGARNGPEECDKGVQNGVSGSGCSATCTQEPFCGDGVVSAGEECDFGQFASDDYGGCTDKCKFGPHCGDGQFSMEAGEECDSGSENTGEYGGCTNGCTLGPRCGDGVVQESEDEECDNGFNEDEYRVDSDSCMAGCKLPPACGDGKLHPTYELCDSGEDNSDSAYEGCSETCEWGPYCGDGVKNGSESCDKGAANTSYSATGSACGYDCKPAAFCGDGQRNGPEQCDAGTDSNTGKYGGCKSDCAKAAYCGDGVIQKSEDEECDDGSLGSLTCSTSCKRRDNFE